MLGVSGSRSITNAKLVMTVLNEVWGMLHVHGVPGQMDKLTGVVVGDCPQGVDAITAQWARNKAIMKMALAPRGAKSDAQPFLQVEAADWGTHGKAAGPIRNGNLVSRCGFLLAIWNGTSPGTRSTISICRRVRRRHLVWYLPQGKVTT